MAFDRSTGLCSTVDQDLISPVAWKRSRFSFNRNVLPCFSLPSISVGKKKRKEGLGRHWMEKSYSLHRCWQCWRGDLTSQTSFSIEKKHNNFCFNSSLIAARLHNQTRSKALNESNELDKSVTKKLAFSLYVWPPVIKICMSGSSLGAMYHDL